MTRSDHRREARGTARAAEAALRASEARFAALVERSSDMICVLDAAGRITYASPTGERFLGAPQGARLGVAFAELVHPDDRALFAARLAELLEQPGRVTTADLRVDDRAGGWRHVEIVAANRFDDPAVDGIVANVRDVTERAETAARLVWQAFHDPLTQLPNRALLLDRLAHTLRRAARSGERTALLFIDLDRFKLVNDTMGHQAGDQLLVEVAARLSRSVRDGDTVARIGGDEFVILAEALDQGEEAERIAERIGAGLAPPVHLPQGPVTISASIGIAYDLDHRPDSLLRDADTALYRAKDRGKDRYEVFDESLRAAAVRRMSTEQLLRGSLAGNDLQVLYQPIADLTTGQVVSAEALVRLVDSSGHVHQPDSFIDIAEESGLIVALGAQVLDTACRALRRWRQQDAAAAPATIAVNVSPRQLAAPSFVEELRHTLRVHGLSPHDLVLEFNEATVIGADRSTQRAVEGLHALGVALSIDDFGTGYSSLAYLKRFPVTSMKLDQAFVAGLEIDASDAEIVKAVLSLGRSLRLTVIAEGIETMGQLATLRSLGCPLGQGFLIAHPVEELALLQQAPRIAALLHPPAA